MLHIISNIYIIYVLYMYITYNIHKIKLERIKADLRTLKLSIGIILFCI